MADITPARKLFDLLVSRDFDPEMLDSSGKPAPDPAEAEIFSFDFRAHSGKDYGTVVVMLGEDNDLEVYCSDNVGRSMEGDDKNDWFSFLEQLKNFAVRNFMTFGIKNLNRLRYSMQGQAAIKEGLFESWTGNRTTSWNGAPTEARLMIRHKKNIAEGDARFRYIESLFIETADSERYKLPFKSLTGGRAMLEHVRQGGRPYDPRGNHIAEMVTELAVLSRFRRANQGHVFEGDTQQLLEQAQQYQANLQRSLKGLSTRTGYTTYFESWSPAEISEQDVVIESLKNLFVKQSIDTRIESALPLLAKIQQQGTAMKEANIFEAWAERLTEGTWQLPDTPEKQAELLELMSTDLPVGADATNVTEQLYDLLGDDELFDQLEALAERDANADARQVVYDRMQELSDHPDVRKVIEQLQIDDTAAMNPAEPTNPADLEPQQPVQEGDLEDCDSLGGDAGDQFIRRVSVDQQDLAENELLSIRRAAGMLTEEELDELNRRDFLKGAGAALGGAALAGIAGQSQAAGNPTAELFGAAELGQWPYMMMWVYNIAKLEKATPSGMFNPADIAKAEKVSTDAIRNFYGKLYDSNPDQRGPYNDMMREVGNEVRKSYQQIAKGDTGEAGTIKKYIANADRLATKLNQYTAQTYGQGTNLKENVLTDDTGSTFQHILDTFKRDVKDFEETGEISDELHNALYDYYFDDMPYGVKKARTGDPYEWVADRFGADLGINGYGGRSPGEPDEDYTLERESVMHGDYAEEAGDPLAKILKIAGVPAKERPAPDYTTGMNEAGSHNGKPTVEYRGIFYVNQPDGSWASLKGDHVAEPAVKQVLDKMHQQSVTNETFIDPNSEYGVNAQGDYVDLKRDAKINANAKAAAAAKAFDTAIIGPDTNPNPGGRFFGAGGGSSDGSGSGGSSGGGSSAPMGGPIPTPPASGSNSGANPMGQMPAKNMGTVQTAAPKLPMPEDEMDEDYSSDSNARSDAGLAGAAAGGVGGAALGSLAGPAGAVAGGVLGAAVGGASGVSSANKDLATAHDAEMQRQADKRTKFVPVGPYNTDKPPPVIPVDTGRFPGLVPLQNKDQPKDTIEDASPLAGKYGHSGKMKEVGKETSFLDRLKELSGLKK